MVTKTHESPTYLTTTMDSGTRYARALSLCHIKVTESHAKSTSKDNHDGFDTCNIILAT